MNKETYEALKRIVDVLAIKLEKHGDKPHGEAVFKDLEQVENWIDEVAKEYEEE